MVYPTTGGKRAWMRRWFTPATVLRTDSLTINAGGANTQPAVTIAVQ
jgi:hypothetical protein